MPALSTHALGLDSKNLRVYTRWMETIGALVIEGRKTGVPGALFLYVYVLGSCLMMSFFNVH